MKKKHVDESQQIHVSFSKRTNEKDTLNQQDSHLKVEIFRVNAIEKQRYVNKLWSLTQQQLCEYLMNYQLFPQNYLTIDKLIDSPKLKLIKSDGKIYFGEVDRRKRQGWGIYIQKSGNVYEGRFELNEKRGKGVQIYHNGNLYIGQFQNNKKHGKGVFYWYNLTLNNTKPKKDYEFYDGEWWGGLPDGQGVHTRNNGDCYIGTLKNGLKHGQGEERYGNGDYYNGQFVNGLPEGYGEYEWSDGSSYKGDFKQGLRSGYGSWKSHKQRGQSYQGHYSSDKKQGYGVYTWDNGWSYKGNFQNDLRNGYGQLLDYKGNLSYKGEWQNGNQVAPNERKSTFIKQTYQNPENQSFTAQEYSDFEQQSYGNQFSKSKNGLQLLSNRKYESIKLNTKAYNRSETGEYATVSAYGQQNLCKRPEGSKLTRASSVGRNVRIRQQIGSKISRPLAPGPEAILTRNYRSSKKI